LRGTAREAFFAFAKDAVPKVFSTGHDMRLRTFIAYAAWLALVAVIGVGIYYWQRSHLWRFSLGSKDEAFLGTTFGMSREGIRSKF